nr:immunoglobulin light chain junction region [Macaca mulatta]MOW27581.1 immunoglobulin light chain junction region [Macaca mulatta]MOW28555.1 immunoglobulin light chain junction region [Macaca mulatta]MOW28857.1 immunoglobulin light chain junction region [Macaca mulatta]MOW29440.1 immunoglobulin light chain junction region [Macaca mulatta]
DYYCSSYVGSHTYIF